MKIDLTALSVPLGFLFAISLFLGPQIYGDYTLLGDSLYYVDPSFKAVGKDVFNTKPLNFVIDVDNTLEGYPYRHYIQTSFARGEFPRWNPYVGMGVPFAGGVLEPVSGLLGLFASPTKLPNLVAVAGLWIAACGMFVFLGALGLSRPARIFGALAFVFSGWTIAWLGRHNFLTEIWMPWLFWAAERLLQRATVGRAGVLALFSALTWLPGHLPTSVHVFAALGVYVLARALRTMKTPRRCAGILSASALSVALGLGVSLTQILPMADLIMHSDLPPQGRGKQLPAGDAVTALWYGIRGDWERVSQQGPTALTTISPLFFGTPRQETYWWSGGNYPETTMYAGLLPLFFALYGFARRREIPGMRVWLALALAPVGIALGLPIFNLGNYLPGFNLINNGRLRLVYRFAVIVAGALGYDRFTASPDPQSRRARLAWIGGFAAAALGLPAAAYFLLRALGVRTAGPSELWAGIGFLLGVAQTLTLAIILAAFAATVFAFCVGRLGPAVFRAAVIVITFAELFWFLHDFNPSIPSRYAFPETPVVQFLKRDPSLFRVSSASFGQILPPNTKLPYRIFDTDLYSTLALDRYAALQGAVGGPSRPGENPAYRAFRFSDPAAHRGLINLMNIKYFAIPPSGHGGAVASDPFRSLPQYRLVYDREVKIYQNLDVLPRAFLVERAVVVKEPATILEALTRADFDPAVAVLLEDLTSPRLPPPEATSGGPGVAEVLSITANRVVVRARVPRPAYLVLSEVYYPGWRAWVDGKETPVYRADYLFRAVYLDPGSHDVVFTFRPRYYLMAGIASLVATVVVGSCLVWGAAVRVKSKLRQKESVPCR